MEILNDFVMPTTKRGATDGSKFATTEQLSIIHGLQIKQTVILPFLAGVKAQRQRVATNYVLNSNELYVKGNQRYAVAIVPEKGIAIQRIADFVPVVAVAAPTEAPAIAPETVIAPEAAAETPTTEAVTTREITPEA